MGSGTQSELNIASDDPGTIVLSREHVAHTPDAPSDAPSSKLSKNAFYTSFEKGCLRVSCLINKAVVREMPAQGFHWMAPKAFAEYMTQPAPARIIRTFVANRYIHADISRLCSACLGFPNEAPLGSFPWQLLWMRVPVVNTARSLSSTVLCIDVN
jgi:hypothetical protein